MQTNNALLTPGTTRSDGALPKQPFAIKAVGYIAFALLGFSFASVICLTFAASLAPKVSDCQARLDKISDAMQECDPNSSHIVDIAWLRLVGNGNLQLTKTWMLAFVAFIVGAIGVLAMVKTNGMAAMGSAAGNCLLWPIAGGLAASTQVAFVLLKQVCSAHGYGGPDGKNHHECVSFFNNQESQMIAQESANCPSLAAIGTKAYIADELWCHNARDGLLEPSEDHCSCYCKEEAHRICETIPGVKETISYLLGIICVVAICGVLFGCVFFCSKGTREEVEEYNKKQQLADMAKAQQTKATP